MLRNGRSSLHESPDPVQDFPRFELNSLCYLLVILFYNDMTDNFFMNLDNAVKFFNLRRVSLEINYYVVSFTLMLDFVRKMTFAPFISIVNGTTDSGNGVLYQFDSSLDNFIISCIHNEHNFILFHEIRLLFGPMSRTLCGPGSYL